MASHGRTGIASHLPPTSKYLTKINPRAGILNLPYTDINVGILENFRSVNENESTRTPQEKEYYAFMLWFQSNHPNLYAKYWKNITIPIGTDMLNVSGTNIDAKDFDTLVQIEYDYYHPEE